MPEKIIFLDFDGPLSNHRVGMQTGSLKHFDPVAIGALNNICRISGAKIVCTSVRAALNNESSFPEACHYFKEAGLDLQHLHEDWSCRYDSGPREGHIQKWMELHPGITHHVIIDDSIVELPNFVRADSYDGIGFKALKEAAGLVGVDLLQILNGATNKQGRWPGHTPGPR